MSKLVEISTFDKIVNVIMKYTKMIGCWEIDYSYMDSNKQRQIYKIPILQYIIAFLYTLFYFRPRLVGGFKNFEIFRDLILAFMIIYLLIRFSYITEQHNRITECDIWIIQTVAFVFLTDFLYNNCVSLIYTKGTVITTAHQ